MLGSGGVLGEGKQIVPPGTMDLHSGITTTLADHKCLPVVGSSSLPEISFPCRAVTFALCICFPMTWRRGNA